MMGVEVSCPLDGCEWCVWWMGLVNGGVIVLAWAWQLSLPHTPHDGCRSELPPLMVVSGVYGEWVL